MSKKITPWVIALVCAIALHLLILHVSAEQKWFNTEPKSSTFELVLLPNEVGSSSVNNDSTPNELLDESPTPNQEPVDTTLDKGINNTYGYASQFDEKQLPFSTNTKNLSGVINSENVDISKPNLLDLSTIELPLDDKDNALEGVFSEELRNKITASQITQQEYLKGQIKDVDYPVINGPDGARYANINGVCWRIPEVGSDEPWAVVFSGCTGKSKTFNIELNIAPNVFLGTDSPLSISK
jgi:hypothetical protein